MSAKYDNYHLCLCLEHTYYEWEKKANKCMQCEKPLHEDEIILMKKDDFILMKRYKFIHPLTGVEQEVHCEKLTEDGIVGGDAYYQCLIEGVVIAQFPKSYAMMRTD
jgi:hypothetical protein